MDMFTVNCGNSDCNQPLKNVDTANQSTEYLTCSNCGWLNQITTDRGEWSVSAEPPEPV